MDRRKARSPGYLMVSKVEIARFVKENACVKSWLRKFNVSILDKREMMLGRLKDIDVVSGSRLNKARILCRFFKWLRIVKSIDLEPIELLDRHLKLRRSDSISDRKWLVNLVLEHSRDNQDFAEYSDRRKYAIFQAVKSFCDFHEVPLTTANNIFGKKQKNKNHRKQIKPSEVKKVLGCLCQRDRTILLIILQSGIEIGSVLNKFGYMWHSQVKPQLDVDCERMKIEFDERKGNGTWYFTYISIDAIHELRKWLIQRSRIVEDLIARGKKISKTVIEGEPIFITNRGKPLGASQFADQLKIKTNGKVTSHMFRKLFESEAKVPDRGVELEYIKFFMGHAPKQDDAGGIYDRNVEFRQEICEKEYSKIEPFINIYSSSVAKRQTDPLLQNIEQLSRLPGMRKVFGAIVEDAKAKLAENYEKLLSETT